MKRLPILLSFVLLCCLGHAQAKYEIISNDHRVGDGEITRQFYKDGSVSELSVFNLKGKTEHWMKTSITTDKSGRPRSKLIQALDFPGFDPGSTTILVLYGPKDVQVEEKTPGGSKTAAYPYPKGQSISSKSFLWFVKAQPKKGDQVVYSDFDPFSRSWSSYQTTYAGQVSVQVNKKKYRAHKLRRKGATDLYVDNKGYPLTLRIGELILKHL